MSRLSFYAKLRKPLYNQWVLILESRTRVRVMRRRCEHLVFRCEPLSTQPLRIVDYLIRLKMDQGHGTAMMHNDSGQVI